MLNRDQFEATRAGDFYCTKCRSDKAKSGYAYFWEKELEPMSDPNDTHLDYANSAEDDPDVVEAIHLDELDTGVQGTVWFLRRAGFETVDSGDGSSKDPDYEDVLPFPHVHMLSTPSEIVRDADRLMAVLEERGVNFEPVDPETDPMIEASYSPVDRHAILSLFNVDDKLLGLEGTV
jgi:hypothetical protein